MKKNWYKLVAVIFVLYTLIAGMLAPVPRLDILNETIRNLYYHVPIWFAMIALMAVSVFYSCKLLFTNNNKLDYKAYNSALVGFFFTIPGITTGSLWAKYTWGAWWTNDPKLNGVVIAMLIYLVYFILRSSIEDENKKATVSAVYNIIAFVMMNVFIMILPRLNDSLHPGNGGNPAFKQYDLDSGMRLIFYPAVIGWIFFAYWLFEIKNRLSQLKLKTEEND